MTFAMREGKTLEYRKAAHAVYLCTYHVVLVTKYRKPCIDAEISAFMKSHSAYLLKRQGGTLVSAESGGDHIHLLIELPPSTAPSAMVKILKTQLSKECHNRFSDHLSQYLYGEDTPLWSASYFLATTGNTAMEKVQEFINNQRTDDHKRKYEKTGKYAKKKSRG